MILLSENGTPIADFRLFISAKALFCIPSCVSPKCYVLMMGLKLLLFKVKIPVNFQKS